MRLFAPVVILMVGATIACDGPRKRAPDPARADGGTQLDSRPDSDGPVQIPDTLASEAGGPDANGLAADVLPSDDAGQVMTAAVCGNGTIESGEQCDPPGSCPSTCPNQGCTRFMLEGSAAACTARCVASAPQTACTANDGCCPSTCNATTDSDCAIKCDNGTKEGMETCDPLASCPTSCPAMGCQLRKLVNQGTCTAACVPDTQQTVCKSGDDCCPSTCNNTNDTDCPAKCGNGVVESGETCDPASVCASRSTACTSTKDLVRTRMGDAMKCTFRCEEAPRPCGPADGQCPTACAPEVDADCRKADGQACNLGNVCMSGQCSAGVCCDSACSGACQSCKVSGSVGKCTKTCECLAESGENLVPGAGFDMGISGWQLSDDASWAPDDATGCPSSGALKTGGYSHGPCVRVAPNTSYNFGVSINTAGLSASGQAEVSLSWYTDSSCTAGTTSPGALLAASGPERWQKKSEVVTSPADAVAARISAHCFSAVSLFDNFYLSRPPATF